MSRPAPAPTPLPEGNPERSDAALVAAVAAGEERAFALLVARHAEWLLAGFRRAGLDSHAAEDCCQETFLRLLAASDSYVDRAPLRGFLVVLARNTLIDWRRRRKSASLTLTDPHEPVMMECRESVSAAEERGDTQDFALDLETALRELSVRQRDVLELSVWGGLPHAEVARRLGIPVGTVKSRLHHAVLRLRARLGGERLP